MSATNQFTISRKFDIAPEELWSLWTDPSQLASWWGPHGFTNVRASIEPKVGGAVEIVMSGFGQEYPMDGKVEAVAAPNCLIFTSIAKNGNGSPAISSRVTLVIESKDGGCELTIHEENTALDDEAEEMMQYAELGMRQSLERLAGLAMSQDRDLVVTRLIDAKPTEVLDAWTKPELIAEWFAPRPFTVSHAYVEPVVGGAYNITMCDPDGNEFPNEGIILELSQNRLVTTDAYTSGWNPSAKPFMTTILTFEQVNGKTQYTARVRHWLAADKQAHIDMGFFSGWGAATDQLTELVTK